MASLQILLLAFIIYHNAHTLPQILFSNGLSLLLIALLMNISLLDMLPERPPDMSPQSMRIFERWRVLGEWIAPLTQKYDEARYFVVGFVYGMAGEWYAHTRAARDVDEDQRQGDVHGHVA